jgi:hypothetical protein
MDTPRPSIEEQPISSQDEGSIALFYQQDLGTDAFLLAPASSRTRVPQACATRIEVHSAELARMVIPEAELFSGVKHDVHVRG